PPLPEVPPVSSLLRRQADRPRKPAGRTPPPQQAPIFSQTRSKWRPAPDPPPSPYRRQERKPLLTTLGRPAGPHTEETCLPSERKCQVPRSRTKAWRPPRNRKPQAASLPSAAVPEPARKEAAP